VSMCVKPAAFGASRGALYFVRHCRHCCHLAGKKQKTSVFQGRFEGALGMTGAGGFILLLSLLSPGGWMNRTLSNPRQTICLKFERIPLKSA
jgi:hypothetical protein